MTPDNDIEQLSPKKRMLGLVIALMIPVASIVISIFLVNRGVNVTSIIKGRLGGKGELLGEKTEKAEAEDDEKRVSVFEKNLSPILTEPLDLEVRAVGIKANLIPVNVDSEGTIETPQNWQEAGWFIQGGKPGEARNLIINGHYDTNTGMPGAFYNLKGIAFGDVVEVEDKYGRIFNYKVVELSYLDIKDPSRLDVLEDEEGRSTLTLITCGGVYLPGSGYNQRLVVKADLLP